MILNKKRFAQAAGLFIFILVLVIYFFWSLDFNDVSFIAFAGFGAIITIAIIGVISDSRIISVNKFQWCFQLVFFGLAPLCQYASGYYPWGYRYSENNMHIAQMCIILWDFIYLFSYSRKRVLPATSMYLRKKVCDYVTCEKHLLSGNMITVFALALVSFSLLVQLIGMEGLFFRQENVLDIEDSLVNFLTHKTLSALPCMICALFVTVNRKKTTVWRTIAVVVTGVITLCANFPTSTTRYWMGTIFIGLVYHVAFKRKNSRIFDYAILFVLMVAFPFFQLFKWYSLSEVFTKGFAYNGMIQSFNNVDFDAFSMLVRTIEYVQEEGFEYGTQLLNIIFFWIPRSLWPGKPLVTSVVVATAQNQTFTNLSMPLLGEAYINFGFVGIVVFAFFFGRLVAVLDNTYWKYATDGQISFINIAYPFLCVITLYICRGALQPATVQTAALLLPLFCLLLILKRKAVKET